MFTLDGLTSGYSYCTSDHGHNERACPAGPRETASYLSCLVCSRAEQVRDISSKDLSRRTPAAYLVPPGRPSFNDSLLDASCRPTRRFAGVLRWTTGRGHTVCRVDVDNDSATLGPSVINLARGMAARSI